MDELPLENVLWPRVAALHAAGVISMDNAAFHPLAAPPQ
jgi:hypothetical protein